MDLDDAVESIRWRPVFGCYLKTYDLKTEDHNGQERRRTDTQAAR